MPRTKISNAAWNAFCAEVEARRAKEDPYDEGFNLSDEQSELEEKWELADAEAHKD